MSTPETNNVIPFSRTAERVAVRAALEASEQIERRHENARFFRQAAQTLAPFLRHGVPQHTVRAALEGLRRSETVLSASVMTQDGGVMERYFIPDGNGDELPIGVIGPDTGEYRLWAYDHAGTPVDSRHQRGRETLEDAPMAHDDTRRSKPLQHGTIASLAIAA